MPPDGAIAAIVLAAGASTRFGTDNKLLADIDRRPMIRRVVEEVISGGVGDIIVVTGSDTASIAKALRGLAVRLVANPDWQSGMGGSIATGMAALGDGPPGVFIVPGDMALLRSQLIAELMGAFAIAKQDRIVYPVTAEGEQRNPVLWPRRYFGELRKLAGERGAKPILKAARADCVPVSTEYVDALGDVDTPDELQAARAKL